MEIYEGDNSYILNRLNETDNKGECFITQLVEESDNTLFLDTVLELGVEINYKNEMKVMKLAIEKGKKSLI